MTSGLNYWKSLIISDSSGPAFTRKDVTRLKQSAKKASSSVALTLTCKKITMSTN